MDDPAAIFFTSGTTGRSKGAVLTQGNLAAGVRAVELAWDLNADDELLLALPLFHVHGLAVGIHGMLAIGHGVTLLPRFDANEVRRRCTERPVTGRAPTVLYGVPTFYHRLLELPAAASDAKTSLRLAVSGSAPLPTELVARFESRFGVPLVERYGMSETLLTVGQRAAGQRRAGWVGSACGGVEIRVVGPDGLALDAGHEGELWVRGPSVGPGYFGDPDASRAVRRADPDGGAEWFATGDLVVVDPERGDLRITGRAKELIITGGTNVHPREIDEVLERHAGVREAAAFGVPDADLGERIEAAVVTRESRATELDRLREEFSSHCAAELAPFKCPRTIHFVDTLPRNALGKIQRSELASTVDPSSTRSERPIPNPPRPSNP